MTMYIYTYVYFVFIEGFLMYICIVWMGNWQTKTVGTSLSRKYVNEVQK